MSAAASVREPLISSPPAPPCESVGCLVVSNGVAWCQLPSAVQEHLKVKRIQPSGERRKEGVLLAAQGALSLCDRYGSGTIVEMY